MISLELLLFSLYFFPTVWLYVKRKDHACSAESRRKYNVSNWAKLLNAIFLPERVRDSSVEWSKDPCGCECVLNRLWVSVCAPVEERLQDQGSSLCRNAPWRGHVSLFGAPGNSWHFFICAPNCWFTQRLIACEVRFRLFNGQGNLARGLQMLHVPPSPRLSPSCLFHSSVAAWHLLCILYLCTLSSQWRSPGKMPSQIVT